MGLLEHVQAWRTLAAGFVKQSALRIAPALTRPPESHWHAEYRSTIQVA